MQASKLKQHVDFEETLDLAPFMKGKTQPQQQTQQRLYELCGVVVHDGSSVRSGHYYRQVVSNAVFHLWPIASALFSAIAAEALRGSQQSFHSILQLRAQQQRHVVSGLQPFTL
jgi:hypothetical protein